MAKLFSDWEIPMHWDVVAGERPGTTILRLSYKSLSAVLAEGIQGGKDVLPVFVDEMGTNLAKDLLRETAPSTAN